MQSFERFWEIVSHNLGTKIVAVVVALVLWFVVLGSRRVELTKEVPLEVITPATLVPANEVPDRVAFLLSGPSAFLRAIRNRREEPIQINLSGERPGYITRRIYPDSIRLPIGVRVVSISPANVGIDLQPLKQKKVPVEIRTRGELPEGLELLSKEVDPPIVKIKGAAQKVEAINQVQTIPINLSEVTSTFRREVPLDLDRAGVQLDGNLPTVTIQVSEELSDYRLSNVDIRVLSPYKVKLSRKTVNVTVRASSELLRGLNKNQVYGQIDLRGKAKGTYTETVKIQAPEGIHVTQVIPASVRVTLH